MRVGLREGLSLWRTLGLRRGAAGAARYASTVVGGRVREARVRRSPPTVSRDEVRTALGGMPAVEALRGPVLAAMPTVASFDRKLASLDEAGRDSLLVRADAVASHRFDLLGSGPVELGARIDWHVDPRTGTRWPLRHGSRLPPTYGDGSDIRLPWELSRAQHLPLLAAAHRLGGERRYLDELGAQLDSWIEANPVELGPNWASTMEVAIRAANWVAALALGGDAVADQPWLDRALASLLLHGRFVRTQLEDGPYRGNHYVANVAGLLPVAALFSRGDEGGDWAAWAARELTAELDHQVHPDGCDFEASIPYHRLVAELFICGAQAAEALVPGSVGEESHSRIERMLQFVADYTRDDGLAPQIGDGDDGRFLPLGDYTARDPRDHRHLFAQWGRRFDSQGTVAYPDGGYYILRGGGLFAIVRCGSTGRQGVGGHAHNDQLSFELATGAQQLVIDPGTYAYTSDPEMRNRFRSTAFHSTLEVDGAEQNELRSDDLFFMPDRTRAEGLAWSPTAFEGRHHGYESLDPAATHTRRVELDAGARTLVVHDTLESAGSHDLLWTFPLAPSEVDAGPGVAHASFDGATLEVSSDGLDFRAEQGWHSPSYGVRRPTPFLRAARRSSPGTDETTFVLRVSDRS